MANGHIVRNLTYWLDDLELWRYRNGISTIGVGAALLLHCRSYDANGRLPCKDEVLARWAGLTMREWRKIADSLKCSWTTEVDENGETWFVVRRVREQIELQREKSEKARRARAARKDTDAEQTHDGRTTDVPRTRNERGTDVLPSEPYPNRIRTEPNRTASEPARATARDPEAPSALASGGKTGRPEPPRTGTTKRAGEVLASVVESSPDRGPRPNGAPPVANDAPSELGQLSAQLTERFGKRGDFRGLQIWLAAWESAPPGAREHVMRAMLDTPEEIADLVAYAERVRAVEEGNYAARQSEAKAQTARDDLAAAAQEVLQGSRIKAHETG